ncbi:MAG TPA: M28 family peptidase [Candidatus Hydrogenedens sp.]|nr:M28 family peptidase [Candidatus Hydrogenedens sp.]
MSTLTKIANDIQFLAGTNITRRYGTEGELLSCEYIRNRLLDMHLQPKIEPFTCSRETFQILSLYWVEFVFVVLLSIFFPSAGLIYGSVVIALYFLELLGYFSVSQFIPEYQSQNIHTVIKNQEEFDEPEYRIIFHANYDCGVFHLLYSSVVISYLPLLQNVVVMCMLTILGVGLRDSIGEIIPWNDNISMTLWTVAGGTLGTLGLIVFISTANEEDTRGANFNASGVACLLALAEYYSQQPLKDTEIHFIFTGAHECWMAGLRHFLKKNVFPKKRTLFINIECVGSGDLHVVTRENMVFTFSIDNKIKKLIHKNSSLSELSEIDSLPIPTSSYMILSHGYKACTLMGLDKDKKPPYRNQLEDTTLNVDEQKVKKAFEITRTLAEAWINS